MASPDLGEGRESSNDNMGKRMHVIKRNGTSQEISFDKVLARIKELCNLEGRLVEKLRPLRNVKYEMIAIKVINSIHDNIKTSELDVIAANILQPMVTENLEYGELAARLLVSNHHKNCEQLLQLSHFEDDSRLYLLWTMQNLWHNIDINGRHAPMIAPHVLRFVEINSNMLEKMLDYERDYKFNYAGFEMAMGSYLLQCSLFTRSKSGEKEHIKENGVLKRFVMERPQHMWMRVALGIWLDYPQIPYREQMNPGGYKTPLRSALEDLKLRKPDIVKETWWYTVLAMTEEEGSDPKADEFWPDALNGVSEDYLERMKSRLPLIKRTYDMLSNMEAMHATPTLFHSGTPTPQMSSCFLTTIPADSLKAIYDYIGNLAAISKWAGGLGSHIHHIRPTGSYIGGTGGTSNGLPSMLRVVNETAKYVDQGGNKRAGSHAIYLELWHGDIEEFCELKLGRGNQEKRAKNLFYAMWIEDEFLRSVEEEERRLKAGERDPQLWYLMDLSKCPGLSDAYDRIHRLGWISDAELADDKDKWDFTRLYRSYIAQGMFIRRISARSLWKLICKITEETGIPYKLHKDAINRKNNQSHIGTIKSSNLCSEITEYSDKNETAVCNLASVCLNRLVVYEIKPINADKYPFADGFLIDTDIPEITKKGWFDFERLGEIVRVLVRNLDQVISQNYYPIPETRRSNMRHRPMGIGVQGLADCFTALWLPFDSEEALKLDYYIFEIMNFESKRASADLAAELGSYPAYDGSPMSFGFFQRDLWEIEHKLSDRATAIPDWNPFPFDRSCDWATLKQEIKEKGQRNSLTLSLMPTASTSTLTGYSPAFEPHNALIYKRRDKMGESYIINQDLQKILMRRNMWTLGVRTLLMRSRTGSIQEIMEIPKHIRDIFKTAYDMSPKVVLNHALIRGPEIDQSQSKNVFMQAADHQKLTQIEFYDWKRGGKTACYYLRQLPSVDAKKIQLTNTSTAPIDEEEEVCTMKDGCVVCSS